MPLGLYISVPFCRTKCSYCNFASDVFSRTVFERYVGRVCSDIERARETTKRMGGRLEPAVDSIFLGGGTPTILDIAQLERLFVTVSQNFEVQSDAEITVECAPGTLTPAVLEAFQRCAVNRVSLGVQSFVDTEAAAVGRLHKRATVRDDIARLRACGIENINIDLIAGLPHQTAQSWEFSLAEAIASGVPHVSVYMLEVDDDSRLGRELMAGGTRYHAHFVPDEDLTADLYETACGRLEAAGVQQYEISNFARPGHESRHNLKYWTRQPYLGFGVDAHSMLASPGRPGEAVRFSSPNALEEYVADAAPSRVSINSQTALEEAFFLGLRLTRGINLECVATEFGESPVRNHSDTISECVELGLLERDGERIRLTARGRLLSNEVFERFIVAPSTV
ncbi:MAG: radical SAM family heme chaperone HemW [Terriglobales bacterium]